MFFYYLNRFCKIGYPRQLLILLSLSSLLFTQCSPDEKTIPEPAADKTFITNKPEFQAWKDREGLEYFSKKLSFSYDLEKKNIIGGRTLSSATPTAMSLRFITNGYDQTVSASLISSNAGGTSTWEATFESVPLNTQVTILASITLVDASNNVTYQQFKIKKIFKLNADGDLEDNLLSFNNYRTSVLRQSYSYYNKGLTDLSTIISSLIVPKSLVLGENSITDITALGTLTTLEILHLDNNQITDISALSTLSALRWLGLENNQIKDITALQNLNSLEELYLDNNKIVNIAAVATLTSLNGLRLSNNRIGNINPIATLTTLAGLYLDNNRIVNVAPLVTLTSLETLDLHANRIVNIAALATLTSVKALYLQNNQIEDISPLKDRTTLEILYLQDNKITDITPLENLTLVSKLDLRNNKITNITPLLKLTTLRFVDLGSNTISNADQERLKNALSNAVIVF